MAGPARLDARLSATRASKYGLAFLAVLLVANVHYINRTFDDAFIFFRYAENIARGKGWVFTAGERVEAYTSWTWTALLALAAKLGAARSKMGLVVVAKLGGIALGAGTVLWVVASSPLVSRRSVNPFRGCVAVLFLTLSAPFALWSVSGLETPLAAFLATMAVHFHLQDRLIAPRPTQWPRSALLFALGVLTRPEIFFLFAVSAAFDLGRDLAARTLRINLRANAAWLVAFLLPCLAQLLWRHSYYGQWLPNTYYAKVDGDPLTWVRGSAYVTSALLDLGLGVTLVAAVLPFALARRVSSPAAYLLVLELTYLFVVALEGGDWMPAFRFVVPILPLIALSLDAGVSEALDRWPTGPGRGLTIALTVLLLAITSARGVRLVPASRLPSGWKKWLPVPVEQEQVAHWMNEHLPRRGLLALGEAGVVPYYTELPVLDLFGLADLHIAHLPGIRHHKFDVDYVLGRKPSYVLFAGKDAQGKVAPIFTYSEQLLKSERFAREYRVCRDFPSFTLYERAPDADR